MPDGPRDGEEIALVLTSVETAEDAAKIADSLVEAGLAACVSCLRMEFSTYVWKGHRESPAERLLIVKTAPARVPEVRDTISALHPYEVPEILQLPALSLNEAYTSWLVAACGPGARPTYSP